MTRVGARLPSCPTGGAGRLDRSAPQFRRRRSSSSAGLTPPRRTSQAELIRARDALCAALYRFLLRCCNKGFIEPAVLRKECASFGIGVVESDLKKR